MPIDNTRRTDVRQVLRRGRKIARGDELRNHGWVQPSPEPDLHHAFGRGGLLRLLYRLGRQAASGVLTLAAPASRGEVYVLRRGAAICADGEIARRALVTRLARSVAEPSIRATFDGGTTAYPPGAMHQLALMGWVRSHLEAQLDGPLAEALVRELAGTRLVLRAELAPAPLDDADRRMLAAIAQPRRLAEIWPLARTPRFRLLAFVHFLRAVGAVTLDAGGAERAAAPTPASAPRQAPAPRPAPAPRTVLDPRARAARQLLGVDDAADADTVKRAYRRLARALHPDLQPDADDQRRRTLERRFAEVTAAYDALA